MIGYTLCYFIVVVPSFFSCSYTPGIIGDPSFNLETLRLTLTIAFYLEVGVYSYLGVFVPVIFTLSCMDIAPSIEALLLCNVF